MKKNIILLIVLSVVAFFLFLIPATRRNLVTLNIGAIFIFFGVYIEKGIALITPGFTPDTLGQFYLYKPSLTEIRTSVAILAVGFLIVQDIEPFVTDRA